MSTKRNITRVVLRGHEVHAKREVRPISKSPALTSLEGVDYPEQYRISFKSFLQLLAFQRSEGRLQNDPGLSKLLEFVRNDECWPETDDYVLLRNHIRTDHKFNSHVETINTIACFEKAWEKFIQMNQ